MSGDSGEGAMSLPTLYSFEGISSRHCRHSNDGLQTFWSKDCILQHTFLQKSLPCTSWYLPFNAVVGHISFSHCLHGVNWVNSLRTGTISITAVFYDSASSLLYWKDLCEWSFWITVSKQLTENHKGFIWTHGFRGLSSWEPGTPGSSLYGRTEAEGS